MRKIGKKQLIVGGVAAAVIAAGAGTALAYWSTTGSGTGSATTGDSSAFQVDIDSTSVGDLTPGGPVDTVTFHVTNNNSGHQNFSNAVASVTDTSHAGCTAADFDVTAVTAAYGDLAPSATADGSFKLQMKNLAGNQDACKGATVHLKVDVS